MSATFFPRPSPAPTVTIAANLCPFCNGFWKAGSTRGMLECQKCGAIALPGTAVKEEEEEKEKK